MTTTLVSWKLIDFSQFQVTVAPMAFSLFLVHQEAQLSPRDRAMPRVN